MRRTIILDEKDGESSSNARDSKADDDLDEEKKSDETLKSE